MLLDLSGFVSIDVVDVHFGRATGAILSVDAPQMCLPHCDEHVLRSAGQRNPVFSLVYAGGWR